MGKPEPLVRSRLWPLTGSYAFFDASIEDVALVLGGWRRGLNLEPREAAVTGSLDELISRLQPVNLGTRELLIRTKSQWTGYFSNGLFGADEGPVSVLAKMLRCRAVYVVWWPVPRYEAVRFQLLADHPTEFLNYERTVDLGRDDGGRWTFSATGSPQPFEELEAYRARSKQDRFTPSMLERYCHALGIRAFDEGFFDSAAVLISHRDSRPDISHTVAARQAQYGFNPNLG